MSDVSEGRSVKGIQDRLKMFEQNKMAAEGSMADNKPLSTPMRKNFTVSEENKVQIDKEKNNYPQCNPPRTRVPPQSVALQSDISPQTQKPPIKRPPPPQISPVKISSSNVKADVQDVAPVSKPQFKNPPVTNKPPLKNPPSSLSRHTKLPSNKLIQSSSIPSAQASDVIDSLNSKLPPIKAPVIHSTEESVHIPKVKVPPSTIAIRLTDSTHNESTSKKLPSHCEDPIIPISTATRSHDSLAPPEFINSSRPTSPLKSAQHSQRLPALLEKTCHPPPPPPPPTIDRLANNVKTRNDSNKPDCPPPVPPPPPITSKSQPKAVIGWATPATGKSITPSIDRATKVVESDKPPPVLVAPPSVELTQKVKKTIASDTQCFPDEVDADTPENDDNLVNNPWYFDVPKSKATELMRDCKDIGDFLVRPSEMNQLVLMVRSQGDVVKKFKIQEHNNGWVLGDPTNCKRVHSSITNLINFYRDNGVKIGHTNLKLRKPVPKN